MQRRRRRSLHLGRRKLCTTCERTRREVPPCVPAARCASGADAPTAAIFRRGSPLHGCQVTRNRMSVFTCTSGGSRARCPCGHTRAIGHGRCKGSCIPPISARCRYRRTHRRDATRCLILVNDPIRSIHEHSGDLPLVNILSRYALRRVPVLSSAAAPKQPLFGACALRSPARPPACSAACPDDGADTRAAIRAPPDAAFAGSSAVCVRRARCRPHAAGGLLCRGQVRRHVRRRPGGRTHCGAGRTERGDTVESQLWRGAGDGRQRAAAGQGLAFRHHSSAGRQPVCPLGTRPRARATESGTRAEA